MWNETIWKLIIVLLAQKASLHMLQFHYVESNVADRGWAQQIYTLDESFMSTVIAIDLPLLPFVACHPGPPKLPTKKTLGDPKETMVKSSSTSTLPMCRVPNLCAGWVVYPTTFGDLQVIGNRVTGMRLSRQWWWSELIQKEICKLRHWFEKIETCLTSSAALRKQKELFMYNPFSVCSLL